MKSFTEDPTDGGRYPDQVGFNQFNGYGVSTIRTDGVAWPYETYVTHRGKGIYHRGLDNFNDAVACHHWAVWATENNLLPSVGVDANGYPALTDAEWDQGWASGSNPDNSVSNDRDRRRDTGITPPQKPPISPEEPKFINRRDGVTIATTSARAKKIILGDGWWLLFFSLGQLGVCYSAGVPWGIVGAVMLAGNAILLVLQNKSLRSEIYLRCSEVRRQENGEILGKLWLSNHGPMSIPIRGIWASDANRGIKITSFKVVKGPTCLADEPLAGYWTREIEFVIADSSVTLFSVIIDIDDKMLHTNLLELEEHVKFNNTELS